MTVLLLAEFATAPEVRAALHKAKGAALLTQDVLTPQNVEGLAEQLEPPPRGGRVGWVMFLAGVTGTISGYFLQWYSAVIDYPINSGGRPLNSWPVFLLVPYEATILLAGIVGVLAWIWMCGLPKLHHPLFSVPGIERAAQDRYFLVFASREGMAKRVEDTLKPLAVHEVQA